MSSSIGSRVRVTVFGESHGEAIGCVLDGLPAGEALDMDAIALQQARRAPGQDATATPRKERDLPRIVSGVLNGKTTGAPLTVLFANENTRSGDYAAQAALPRPGHADFTAYKRYGGHHDGRGGGHFSGRLTAPLVFAGAVCRGILQRRGIVIGAHIARIADVADAPFDAAALTAQTLEALSVSSFALLDPAKEGPMREAVAAARAQADSVGGVIEVAAVGLPAGLGSPMFEGVENRLAPLFFGIPAVKGVEFGDGFALTGLRGSEANDAFVYAPDGRVVTKTNHNGGILGGITTGMPLVARLAIKPTPSIGRAQETVNLLTGQNETLCIKGRHDPCIVPRAVPVAEAVLAIGLLDLLETESPAAHRE